MVAPNRDRPEVPGLLDGAEHDLVELVRVREQLVVVELDDERNAVRPVPRHSGEHAERRGDPVAPAFDGELDDLAGVEILGIGSERRACRVLDALVDGEDRHVARAPEPAVLIERREVAEHPIGAVGARPDAVDEIGPRQVQRRAGNRLAFVLEQGRGVLAEELFDGRQWSKALRLPWASPLCLGDPTGCHSLIYPVGNCPVSGRRRVR